MSPFASQQNKKCPEHRWATLGAMDEGHGADVPLRDKLAPRLVGFVSGRSEQPSCSRADGR